MARAQPGRVAILLTALTGLVAASWMLVVAAGPPVLASLAALVAAATCFVHAGFLRRGNWGGDVEGRVWLAFSRAAACVGSGLLAEAAMGLAVRASFVGVGWAGVGFAVGAAGSCAFVYHGLIVWNQFRVLDSDSGDLLAGISAGLAAIAVGGLMVHVTDAPMASWPQMAQQMWLGHLVTLLILLGTAATVISIGGLGRDRRLRAVTWALGLVVVVHGGLGFLASAAVVGAVIQVLWLLFVGVLTACTLGRPAPLGRARDQGGSSPVVGALVVLAMSTTVLAVNGFVGEQRLSLTVVAYAAALGSGVRIMQLVASLAQLTQSQREARTDELTGVANRRALAIALRAVAEGERDAALLVIDLDRFKEINDQHGHSVGDEVLRTMAHRLQGAIPAQALLGRLGGDEFAVLMADAAAAEAEELAWALVESCTRRLDTSAGQMELGASVGVAISTLGGHHDGELMRRADTAMYVAKRAGGGVSTFDRNADVHARGERDRLAELRFILGPDAGDEERDQIAVHYQPQLDARTGRVSGAEALVRWQHPKLGLLSPAVFLDLVERHGLMVEMTTLVVRKALEQADRWNRAGHPIRLSVNLSPSVLTHPDLVGLIDAEMAASHLGLDNLVLEITETTLMSEPERALQVVSELAARGVGISIDDYGTGHSSLAYLTDLPAVELKLDRTFTARVLTEPRTAAIVASTINLAHGLGLRLVAEGVEDQATLEMLRRLGCDETQGFLHARPMPPDYFVRWLEANQPTLPPTELVHLPTLG